MATPPTPARRDDRRRSTQRDAVTIPATPLELVSFVSVDVETTGLDPKRDRIVEIGAVKTRAGKILDEWSTLVTIDITIPYAAARVNQITNDMLVGQPLIEDALAMLHAFTGDGTLVEHSWKAFDLPFLEEAHGGAFSVLAINTCTLSRKLFPFHRKHSLEECCRRHQIANRQQHRALGDARATAELLLAFLPLCVGRYPRLNDLAAIAAVER